MPGKSASFNDWKVIGFKGYLADDSVLSTRDIPLGQWPKSGYIALNAYFDHSWEGGPHKDTVAGDNFYFINPPNWREYDGVRRATDAPAGALLFEGVEMEKADFLRIYNRAYSDREF